MYQQGTRYYMPIQVTGADLDDDGSPKGYDDLPVQAEQLRKERSYVGSLRG